MKYLNKSKKDRSFGSMFGLQKSDQVKDMGLNEEKFKLLAETANEGIWVIDKDRKTTYMNLRMLDILGYKKNEVLNKCVDDFILPEELAHHRLQLKERQKGKVSSYERRFVRKNGEKVWCNVSAAPIIYNNKINGSFAMILDITDRKNKEVLLAHTYRALKMLSDISRVLTRASNENELLKDVCNIVVKTGSYPLAWIAFVQKNKEKSLTPIASAGNGRKYVKMANLTWADTERGRGPSGLAVRTGKTQLIKNITTDSKMIPWQKMAAKHGYKSSIALPLKFEREVIGVLNIYSEVVDVLNKDEILILEEMANDLSFGIANQRNNAKQRMQLETIARNEVELKEAQRIGHFGNWSWDISTDKIVWSDEYYRIFGIDSKLPPPNYKDHLAIYTTESAKLLDAAVKKSVKFATPYEIDLEIAHPKDGCRWITARSEAIFNSKGKVIGLRGTAQDITSRREVEERMKAVTIERELAYSESKKLSEVVENTFESVAIIDYGKTNLFLYVNQAWETMFGYKKDEIIFKRASFLLDVLERDIDLKIKFLKSISKGEVFSCQVQMVKKNGEMFWADSSVFPLRDKQEKIYTWCNIIRDISDAKAADKAKTEFVSLASHQLRTPLTGSKWFLELLARDPEHTLTADQRGLIDGVVFSNERTISLVNDLLSAAHIDTGKKLNLSLKKTDVIPLVAFVADEKKHMSKSKKVVIRLDKNSPLQLALNIDKDKIVQVLENLVDNAIKYSKPNTEIILGVKPNSDHVTFFVKDQGIGIPFANQRLIFNRFFRADNASKVDNTGTGLGLYIAKGIVEYHKGKIWFESEEGKGSTFYFSLPL